MKAFCKHKLNRNGYGLTTEQIDLLKTIEGQPELILDGLLYADLIERQFTRFHFQIGEIGAVEKVVIFRPFDCHPIGTDEGKYWVARKGETLSEALAETIKAIPAMFSYCANPSLCFKVNKEEATSQTQPKT